MHFSQILWKNIVSLLRKLKHLFWKKPFSSEKNIPNQLALEETIEETHEEAHETVQVSQEEEAAQDHQDQEAAQDHQDQEAAQDHQDQEAAQDHQDQEAAQGQNHTQKENLAQKKILQSQ